MKHWSAVAVCVTALSAEAAAQPVARSIPSSFPAAHFPMFNAEKTSLDSRVSVLRSDADVHNSKCSDVAEGSTADASCKTAQTALQKRIADYARDVDSFNRRLDELVALVVGAIRTEQEALASNSAAWYRRQATLVSAAVRANRAWTRRITEIIRDTTTTASYAITRLEDLTPGDVILVAAVAPHRDPVGSIGNAGIVAGDYLVRAASDFASGGTLAASQTQARPASHAFTFVKSVNGTMLFLNHTPAEGSRIINERQMLTEYGFREMYVARPQAVVDGRKLWSVAREAALQRKSDFGITGRNVVCSERAGIAVARATGGMLPNSRLGPVDITPGDFFDSKGNVGKHFVVTHLRITPPSPR